MAKKQLHCEQCSKFMGTITDGRISKGLKVLCTKCFTLLTTPSTKSVIDDLLKDNGKADKFSDLFGDSDMFK